MSCQFYNLNLTSACYSEAKVVVVDAQWRIFGRHLRLFSLPCAGKENNRFTLCFMNDYVRHCRHFLTDLMSYQIQPLTSRFCDKQHFRNFTELLLLLFYLLQTRQCFYLHIVGIDVKYGLNIAGVFGDTKWAQLKSGENYTIRNLIYYSLRLIWLRY